MRPGKTGDVPARPQEKQSSAPSPFGQRLAEVIEARDIAPAELARRSTVDHSIISRILRPSGKHRGANPRPDVVTKLADALGVEVGWLLSGKGKRDTGTWIPGPSPPAQPPPLTLARPQRTVEKPSRYPNLESAIAYWSESKRWSPATVAAARELALQSGEDPSPQEWTPKLDKIEETVRKIERGEEVGREVADDEADPTPAPSRAVHSGQGERGE